jgi:hypothetical protein
MLEQIRTQLHLKEVTIYFTASAAKGSTSGFITANPSRFSPDTDYKKEDRFGVTGQARLSSHSVPLTPPTPTFPGKKIFLKCGSAWQKDYFPLCLERPGKQKCITLSMV